MAFQPYDVYDARLPKLKPGFFIEIGGKFYQIMVVRNNRQDVDDIAAAYADPGRVLNVGTAAAYEALHGNLDVGRIVQIQYVSVANDTPEVLLKWGTEPLFSKWVNLYIGNNHADLSHPIQVDRWSYDAEMRLSVIKAIGAQTLWFEIVEYEVVPWEKTPPKKYLKILANGQAVFVEAG